jgi:hypothetical protein
MIILNKHICKLCCLTQLLNDTTRNLTDRLGPVETYFDNLKHPSGGQQPSQPINQESGMWSLSTCFSLFAISSLRSFFHSTILHLQCAMEVSSRTPSLAILPAQRSAQWIPCSKFYWLCVVDLSIICVMKDHYGYWHVHLVSIYPFLNDYWELHLCRLAALNENCLSIIQR